tara:strand:- start:449 stop:982 length:534 start_codon:yes stop_codon:yes gene_type:complete
MSNFKKREERQAINEQIRYNELRVLDESGQLGVMSKVRALEIAKEQGLDLVVITETVEPPVAKILDATKHFYEQKKREKEVAKKQREGRVEVKEIQFRPGIGIHDFETKLKHIDNFLNKGAKVRCMVRYKGRENANKQIGFEVLQRIVETLENSEWETHPNINGNKLIGVLKRGKNG